MPPRKCCCGECPIGEDNFNRADSTNVGADWDEILGDWRIESNKLVVDETAIIRNLGVNSFGSNSQYVTATIERYQDDTKYRIYIQMDITGSTYYYAEWHYVDSSTMYFTLGDEGGPIETIGPDTPISEGQQMHASMTSKNQLCMSDVSSRITICMPPKSATTNKWAGLGAGNSNGAAFDNYVATATDAEDIACNSCDCTCKGWCIPDALIATIQEINECPDLDGFTIDLDNIQPPKFGSDWVNATVRFCPSPDSTMPIQALFTCGGDDQLGTFQFLPIGGALDSDPVAADPDVSTCHPISMRFGPFNLGSVSGCARTTCCGGFPCGSGPADQSLFYVWVTKRLGDYDH